ncbi:hypothetical protein [Pedobacter sp. JY14-1]|uniref:hypothetical protein n=1 Tax=Pedobacter sp. JY14-1 TaxID=3034151 RepID=UPI0023E1BD3B|nr:hypothetical protein [Pedobacter sp. JY14-1]
MRYVSLYLSFFFFLSGCSPSGKEKKDKGIYFDLEGYVNKEISRLSKENPLIHKTVAVNGSAEHKRIKIADWRNELSALSAADINKTAWSGYFTADTEKTDSTVSYRSDDKKINVKELKIIKQKGRLKGIYILIRNTNMLYASADTLTYFPDSIYELRKTQQIRFLEPKRYRVTLKMKE